MNHLIIFLFFLSLKVFSMDCSDNTTVTGEYWAYKEPSGYSFDYFKFYPYLGGHSGTDVSLKYVLNTSEFEYVVERLLKEKNNFPYSYLSVQKGVPLGVRIEVYGYMLFDYDMRFVKKIEALIRELVNKDKLVKLKEPLSWGKVEYYRPVKKSNHVVFNETGIGWVHTSPNKKTGLESQRLRLDLHHNGNVHEKEFFRELKSILDESQIENLEYQEYMNNYMIFLGNGRQGLNGNEVTCSNFELLKGKLLILLSKHGFNLGHGKKFVSYKVGLDNYNNLVQSPVHTLKDERSK
jgi:hypothetical protein